MKKRYTLIIAAIVLFSVLSLAVLINNTSSSNISNPINENNVITRIEMSASWASAYPDIRSLTNASDFIGLVSIEDVVAVDVISSGFEEESENGTLYLTTYSARVISAVYPDLDLIKIVLTGRNDGESIIEIADDPLMKEGETCFIFARLNDRGSYTILSGPNGRFSYNETNDTITSLPNSPIELFEMSLSEIESEIRLYLN